MAIGITTTDGKDLDEHYDAKYLPKDTKYLSSTNNYSFTATTHGERAVTVPSIVGTIDETSTSGSGNISSTTFTFSTIPGIPAGKYTLVNLLQRLVAMSHTHKTAKGTVSKNCNCACNQDCICDSGCFVEGCILTARGNTAVNTLHVGDKIWGADGQWHEVLGIATNVVGARKVHQLAAGGVVTADHVVFSGECAYVPSMTALGKSNGMVITATNGVTGVYGAPSEVMEIDGANLSTVPADTPTYSPICDKSFIGFLNGERVLIAGVFKC